MRAHDHSLMSALFENQHERRASRLSNGIIEGKPLVRNQGEGHLVPLLELGHLTFIIAGSDADEAHLAAKHRVFLNGFVDIIHEQGPAPDRSCSNY